jgi:hypothetical protein
MNLSDMRTRTLVSEDQRWFIERTWTFHRDNLAWFVHDYDPSGDYDALSVRESYNDAGQTAEDVLRQWQEALDEPV